MAVLQISIPDGEIPRVRAAFGAYWQLGRPATAEEIRTYLIRQVKGVVRQADQAQAAATAAASVTDPTVV